MSLSLDKIFILSGCFVKVFETKVAEAHLNTNDFRGHCNVKLKLVSHPMITKCFCFFAQLDGLLVVNLLLIANLASTISKSVQLF